MERADGNRRLWLLKSTSDHHRPECLAAALALGVLAGLVPKLNLLAVILYGLIIFLPVHTWLAILVSVGVALVSYQLDWAADALGARLLRHSTLSALWSSLERVPLVPWMSLHNTVVMGHLAIGTVLVAPIYLVSLRIFERLEYGARSRRAAQKHSIQSYAPVSTEETEPLTTKPATYPNRESSPTHRRSDLPKPVETTVDRASLIIPPPKLHRSAGQSQSTHTLNVPDEPVVFEPMDEVPSRINAWHMNRATGEPQYAQTGTGNANSTGSLTARSETNTAANDFFPQMTQATSSDRLDRLANDKSSNDKPRDDRTGNDAVRNIGELPQAPVRPEGVLNSRMLAQNAGEVLSWVDDLLDECMAEEGMTLGTSDQTNSNSPYPLHASSDMDPASSSGAQARWLVETTIEIVRLTDDTISDQLFVTEQSIQDSTLTETETQINLCAPRLLENSRVMPAESMTRAWPSINSGVAGSSSINTAMPTQDAGEPTILNLQQATGRGSSDQRTGFQQLVMADVNKDTLQRAKESLAGELSHESRATVPIEPVKGECLAYLLGHLRQTREGKSS